MTFGSRDPGPTTLLRWRQWRLAAAAAAILAPAIPAAETPVPPQKHAERRTFDPQSGSWTPARPPVPGTEDGDLDIARQWMARQEYDTARKILKTWFKDYGSASPRYPEALYLRATADLERGHYDAAHDAYQELLNDYPGSPYAERALSGEFRIAEQYLAGKRRRIWGGLLRLTAYDEGVGIMDDVRTNYADTPLAEKAQMAKANYYYAQGEFQFAQDEYAAFARDYPRSRWHARALLRSAESALASFPGVQFDDASLLEARERYVQFRQLYPDQAKQLEVQVLLDEIANRRAEKTYEIARFYERTGHPGAARFYYRAILNTWPDAPAAAQAEVRLAALPEPEVAEPEAGEGPPADEDVEPAGPDESRPETQPDSEQSE